MFINSYSAQTFTFQESYEGSDNEPWGWKVSSPNWYDCVASDGFDYQWSQEGDFSNLSNLRSIVLTRAGQKANNGWDALTSALEAPKTVSTVIDLIRGLLPALRRYRRLFVKWVEIGVGVRKPRRRDFPDLETFRKALDVWTELWLLWRFTIRTTMFDISDAVEASNKISSEKREFLRTNRGTHRITDEVIKTLLCNGGNGYEGSVRGIQHITRTVTVRATIHDRLVLEIGVQGKTWDSLSLNPVATAWELVPFSFMVDWLMNIGGWITSHQPMSNMINERFVSVTTKTEYKDSGLQGGGSMSKTVVQGPWVTTRSYDHTFSGQQISSRTYEREVYSSIPPTLPPLNIRLDLTKWMDVLTILRGMTGSKH